MLKKAILALAVIGILILVFNSVELANSSQKLTKSYLGKNQQELEIEFTSHFNNFLKNNGYDSFDFGRADLKCAAFGGKNSDKQSIKKYPIVFIHGNSDLGFGRGKVDGYADWQTGFRSLATYFISQGYTQAQLYTTTWGPADLNKASLMYHSKDFVMRMRNFVQAVLKYTGAQKINVISHSMGVTIARKIIKGGAAEDHSAGLYYVGQSLKSKINVFIGIAGGNYGLTNCYGGSEVLPCCSPKDGFYPGLSAVSPPAQYLNDLNNKGGAEGDKVISIWSKYDDTIMYECLVWGKVTCRIPGQNEEIQKTTKQWGHMALRDNTGPDIIKYL